MNMSRGWTVHHTDTIWQFKYLILYAMKLFEPGVYGFLGLLFMLPTRSANIVTIRPLAWPTYLVNGAINEGKDFERAVVQSLVRSRGTVMIVPNKIFLHVCFDCIVKKLKLREDEFHQLLMR